ncbi:MAG: hypothetical protein CMF59_08295 [Leptospiraceae bacterium]|nr:hypothetical protein [Leptospiraceae bacterium]
MIRSLKSWATLVRLANGFTALSNILAAYLFIGFWKGWLGFPWYLVAATLCFYYAGMILNDVFDRESDALERPERPLPRGWIKPGVAAAMGYYLLICGLIFAAFQGQASFLIALLLSLSILLYDRWIKRGLAGSMVMGFCRYLNWLLGLSFLFATDEALAGIRQALALGYAPEIVKSILLIPVPIFFYVFSLTLLSKEESRAARKWPLYIAILGILLGAATVLVLFFIEILSGWWGLIVLLAGLIYLIYRLLILARQFEPESVQAIIKLMVLGIIPLDATLVLSASESWMAFPGFILVISLLWPARTLARRYAVT